MTDLTDADCWFLLAIDIARPSPGPTIPPNGPHRELTPHDIAELELLTPTENRNALDS